MYIENFLTENSNVIKTKKEEINKFINFEINCFQEFNKRKKEINIR
jgi:hypothetical protein